MKQFLEKLRVEDWVTVWLSIPLLLLAIFIPHSVPSVPSTFVGEAAWHDILILFIIVLVALYLGSWLMRRPMKGMLWSLIFVFAISMLAQVVAKIDIVKEFGFEAVFFSVIFGLIIRNAFHIPEWLKPAIQGEFFIKIGVVCLGATVLFSDVMRSGAAGLLQACLVVAVVWFFAYFVARKLRVERATAMTLASGCSICGVSACITAAGVAGTDRKQLSYIISVVLIIVVPMIYLMPWLANMIVPLLTDNVAVQSEITGAWIGGTIDTTSGVGASSAMAGDVAQRTAIIVKATQNVLIGVVAFFIALYLSARGEGKSGVPSLGIVWDKFPKFILGFVLASAIFSILQSQELLTLDAKGKIVETAMAKNFSTFFFSLSFVCIGMDTRLKDIVSRENRRVLWSFLGAQTFNIIVTFFVAWLMFGVVKPALEGDAKSATVAAELSTEAAEKESAEAASVANVILTAPVSGESEFEVTEFTTLAGDEEPSAEE